MESIRELYKIGNGPSSSHTMGPKKAALAFLNKYSNATKINVTLYGSLALTGKGHLTDYIIKKTISDIECNVVFDYKTEEMHQNTMRFEAYYNDELLGVTKYYSIGGGSIIDSSSSGEDIFHIYDLKTFNEIKEYCLNNDIRLYDYVYSIENDDFKNYLKDIYDTMLKSVERGLSKTGVLPGDLKLKRKAKLIYENNNTNLVYKKLICAYAYAVSEENASGGEVVTAPTCGASGVLPSLVRYITDKKSHSEDDILNALATSGLIGNLIKHNASISGAIAGCQAEIGSACAMGAAFLAEINKLSLDQIEQSSEIALEHHLGLTCDPIKGYVQIPCIERNAVGALRAIDAFQLSTILNYSDSMISLDLVIETMLQTGHDLKNEYKETSEGGLARHYRIGNKYERI